MDPSTFEKTLSGIQTLNASEGPSRNIYEPKFEARVQAEKLKDAVEGKWKISPSLEVQEQMARLYLFLGNNHFETEEEQEALILFGKAYFLVKKCIDGNQCTANEVTPVAVKEILSVSEPLTTEAVGFSFVATYMDVINSFGVYLAQREEQLRIDDARKVLHVAEACYTAWSNWFEKQPNGCRTEDLTLDDSFVVVPIEGKDATIRHKMDSLFTTTLFCLAQAYSLKSDVRLASKYCHLTMVRQLQSKKEFDKKDWATNALQLSAFYSSEGHYGCALHCLEAGQHVMPKEPRDEETFGCVAWAFGKYHKGRLRTYSEHIESGATTVPTAQHDGIGRTEWWVDFPVPIAPPKTQPTVASFEAAKSEFILANKYMNEAKKFYLMDGSCTDHIALLQDQSEILRMLAVVEPDEERRIAMHMTRSSYLNELPYELNPQAYTTLIRQLLFDLGDINSDILDMRIQQRKKGFGKPYSDKKMNKLCDRSKKFFWDFLDSFKEKGATDLPTKVEADLQVPFFRAFMRIAGLETKKYHATAKEEYDSIGRAIERYSQCVKFADNNPGCAEHVRNEVSLAKEMATLLPGKQKEIMRANRN